MRTVERLRREREDGVHGDRLVDYIIAYLSGRVGTPSAFDEDLSEDDPAIVQAIESLQIEGYRRYPEVM